MDKLLMFFTIAACLIAAARIVVLLFKRMRREKEVAKAEEAHRIVFYDEIDELCVLKEIKKSGMFIFEIIVCPAAMLEVWYCSYAGPFSKTVTLISVVVWIVYTIRAAENRQA